MKWKQNGPTILLIAALAVVGYGIFRTERVNMPLPRTTRRAPSDRSLTVDQGSLVTAERLVRMPTSTDERTFANDALRLADQEMDLAFAQAVRRVANQQRPLSAEAKEIDAQLQKALKALDSDQAMVTDLTAQVAKSKASEKPSLTDRLDLAKAQAALDQDEVDDARQDLRRAGGDPQGRMQEMIADHDAASRSSDSVRVVVAQPVEPRGLIRRLQALQALNDKDVLLNQAKKDADSLAIAFKTQHDRMEARAAARHDSVAARLTHDSSAALLAETRRQAASEKSRSTLDQRIDNQHKLSDVYAGWLGVLGAQERTHINRALRGLAIIIAIVLIGLLLARWIEHIVSRTSMDRRRAQTLYMVSRVSLQVIGVLLILLVVFGPPDNLGTFLGLAGAGLTVALKDFIVGFLGWFVLMGRNGIRIGDLVEINGVTGEVVELGMFYTVLLETGAWSASGQMTGRRVTFTNGFAIEGHYFNFSTSRRWLWDEVRIDVPAGRDPYPIVEAIRAQIEEVTAESARQADAEWKAARRTPAMASIAAAPSIHLEPAGGGVQIVARYITHVAEREELRTKLYHTAVTMLGGTPTPPSPVRAIPAGSVVA